jgi:hypothetical protein
MLYKFTDSGLVTFFFYADETKYQEKHETFVNIFKSYNTENIEAKLPKENLKVADIDTDNKKDYTAKDDSDYTKIIPFAALAFILFIVLRRRKRKKDNS